MLVASLLVRHTHTLFLSLTYSLLCEHAATGAWGLLDFGLNEERRSPVDVAVREFLVQGVKAPVRRKCPSQEHPVRQGRDGEVCNERREETRTGVFM